MPDQQWFYAQGDETTPQGPVSTETLRESVAAGRLPMDTRVWCEGMGGWETAAMRPELTALGVGSGAAVGGIALPPLPAAFGSPAAFSSTVQSSPAYGIRYATAPAYAGFWLRFAAYIIDYLITVVLGFIVGFTIAVGTHVGPDPHARLLITRGARVLGVIASWLYFSLMESSASQATVGKLAVGIKVTDEAGDRIGFGRATGRFFAKFLSLLILFIGFMMAGWTAKKQALHDIIAGTLVVKKPEWNQ